MGLKIQVNFINLKSPLGTLTSSCSAINLLLLAMENINCKLHFNKRLALFVATVATDSAVFVATIPVSQNVWLSLLFYFVIEIGSRGTLHCCAWSRNLFGL